VSRDHGPHWPGDLWRHDCLIHLAHEGGHPGRYDVDGWLHADLLVRDIGSGSDERHAAAMAELRDMEAEGIVHLRTVRTRDYRGIPMPILMVRLRFRTRETADMFETSAADSR
jgi:hypothetical protein